MESQCHNSKLNAKTNQVFKSSKNSKINSNFKSTRPSFNISSKILNLGNKKDNNQISFKESGNRNFI